MAASLRVCTFNIRYDNPADGEDAWSKRANDVATLLLKTQADIIGVQEALSHQVDELGEALASSGYSWVGVGRNDGKRSGEHCPIFYRNTIFERLSWGTFWLSENPTEPGSRFEGSLLPRLVTWVILRPTDEFLAKDLNTVCFFNTHFDHWGDDAREKSAKLILKQIPDIAGLHRSIVVGDLNCGLKSSPIRTLSSSFLSNCYDSLPNNQPSVPTFTGFGLSDHASIANDTIDYVFTSGFIPSNVNVWTDLRANKRRISDHRPVVVDLDVKKY